MNYEERSNLRISGAGSAGGGSFNEVRISGAGVISGDVDCHNLHMSGASEIKGNVRAVSVKGNGASEFKGNVTADEMEIHGGSNIKGDAEVKKVKITGGSQIDGSLHSVDVEVKGGIEIKGDCEAESFNSLGGFTIGGLLNADTIYINMGGNCRVKEIGGEKIEVRKSDSGAFAFQKMIKNMFNLKYGELITDTIEGDDIYLESTTARVVRGNNITIGPGCNIDLIEYKDHINVSQGASVKEQKKV